MNSKSITCSSRVGLFVTDEMYIFLRNLSAKRKQTMAEVVKRLIADEAMREGQPLRVIGLWGEREVDDACAQTA